MILFSGKLSYRKGVDLILNAIQTLPQPTQSQLVVLFLGDGDLKKQLEFQAQAMPQTKVIFLGFKNQSMLSGYYNAADVLVLPSRYSETWGLVVNEALHHGLPCIVSSSVGCAPDLVQPGITGYIFQSDSIVDLATAINNSLALCHNPSVQKMCKSQVDEYSIEKAALGIAQAYDSVC